MTRTSVSVAALVSTIAGTAFAQPAPPPAPAQPAPAPELQAPPVPEQTPAAPSMAPPTTYPPEPTPPPQAQIQVYDVPTQPMPQPRAYSNEGHFMVGVNWNLAFPVGSMTDFTNDVSGLGFELMFRYWVSNRINVGLSTDWQTFLDNRPRTTYPLGNGAVTATAYNSVRTGTVRLGGDYYFVDGGTLQPFAGVNIGFGWSTFQSEAADIVLYDNQNSVVLGAGVGLAFMFSRDAPKLLLSARYTAQPSASFGAANDIQTIGLQAGIASP